MPKLRIFEVLLVEDDHKDAKETVEIFEQLNGTYEVSHSESLEAALRVLKQQEFDLILLDINLPDSKEIDTFRAIKNHLHQSLQNVSTPIIVISDTNNHGFISQILKEGARDYLVKGQFTAEQLERSIRYATYATQCLPKRSPASTLFKRLF